MTILQDGLSLDVNVPVKNKYVCPYCGKAEGTILTKEEDKVIFTCFRVKCPGSGTKVIPFGSSTSYNTESKKKNIFEPTVYQRPIYPLLPSAKKYMENTYDITIPKSYGFGMESGTNRILIRLYDIAGKQWGIGSRSFHPRDKVCKFILYPERDASKLYFPPVGIDVWRQATTIVLVEDIFSAIKLTQQHMPAAALLGTSLSDSGIKVLQNWFDNVIIWLDHDTWKPPPNAYKNWKPKPLKMKEDMRLFFNSVCTVCTEEDPKDLNHDKIEEILNDY